MNRSLRKALHILLRALPLCALVLRGLAPGLHAATYHVAQTAAASDENAGTEAAPWKTISRAALARELKPGDTVLIRSGVYRESVAVTVSGSQNTWIVPNTVAENASGIVAMTRGEGEPARNTRVLNNLFVRTCVTCDTVTRGSDLTLETPAGPAQRKQMGSVPNYNVYADNAWTPWMRHNWNDNNTLAQWQSRYGQEAVAVLVDLVGLDDVELDAREPRKVGGIRQTCRRVP